MKIERKGNMDPAYLPVDDDSDDAVNDPLYNTEFLIEYDLGSLTYPVLSLCVWGWSYLQQIDHQAIEEMSSEAERGYTELLNNTLVKELFVELVEIASKKFTTDLNSSRGGDEMVVSKHVEVRVVDAIRLIMMSKILNARSGMLIKFYKESIRDLRTIHLRDKLKANTNK